MHRSSTKHHNCGDIFAPRLLAVNMEPKSNERLALEELWRLKLRKAHERYKNAESHYRKVLDEQTQGLLTPPDGSLALRQAHARESSALADYTKILQQFAELVLRGKVP
jgi:hypothetical protein